MKSTLKHIALLCCIILTSIKSDAQTAVFGFQFEPITPSAMFRIKTTTIETENVVFSINPKSGYAFGAYLAINISKRFTVESGINSINRDFSILATEKAESHLLEFSVVNFELPLSLTYYVRLSEKLFMGHTLGISFQIPPSHLISRENWIGTQGGNSVFEQLSIRRYWIVPTYKGGVGLEYRTENSGSFYVGPTYHLFSPIYSTNISYRNDGIDEHFRTKPIGDFFGILLRYNFAPTPFLHKSKKKQ